MKILNFFHLKWVKNIAVGGVLPYVHNIKDDSLILVGVLHSKIKPEPEKKKRWLHYQQKMYGQKKNLGIIYCQKRKTYERCTVKKKHLQKLAGQKKNNLKSNIIWFLRNQCH